MNELINVQMNELQIFESSEFGQVRTVVIENEPWFVGKDVANILGYANTKDAISSHVEEDDKTIIQRSENTTLEIPNRGLTFINESGLYSLIFSSKLPNAKKFKRWVTSEVLPTIRKHGMYATEELLDNPDVAIAAFTALKAEREKRKLLEAQIEADKPKVIFAEAVDAAQTSILVGDLAKLLKQNGINTGQKRLFEWLRANGYLIGRKGNDYNSPTQKSMELGLFEIKERTINNPDGSIRITKTPKVTGKGQVYFINKFLKDKAC